MQKNGPDVPVPPRCGGAEAAGDGRKPEEMVVIITRRAGKCAGCGKEFFDGAMIRMEHDQSHCLDCADLGHLEFLPRGNTALTRRATKHSPLRAVVVQWARARQRYERQGILVTIEAIDRAESECQEDAGVRELQRARAAERREGTETAYVATVTAAIRALFPGCPPAEAEQIAAWTCQKHSGRVGRSAAAKDLDPQALKLAVIAHIRHEHTGYDRLLMRHGDRESARFAVRAEIDRILRQWETAGPGLPEAGRDKR
ncbi:MAG: DUF2293 domain-containing protein [Opitutae bacterium]|nr:DUF2293 domain-containing protein [Opitutae bacterium]